MLIIFEGWRVWRKRNCRGTALRQLQTSGTMRSGPVVLLTHHAGRKLSVLVCVGDDLYDCFGLDAVFGLWQH